MLSTKLFLKEEKAVSLKSSTIGNLIVIASSTAKGSRIIIRKARRQNSTHRTVTAFRAFWHLSNSPPNEQELVFPSQFCRWDIWAGEDPGAVSVRVEEGLKPAQPDWGCSLSTAGWCCSELRPSPLERVLSWAMYPHSHLPVFCFLFEIHMALGSHWLPCVSQATAGNADLRTSAWGSLAGWHRGRSELSVWGESRVGNTWGIKGWTLGAPQIKEREAEFVVGRRRQGWGVLGPLETAVEGGEPREKALEAELDLCSLSPRTVYSKT